MLSPSTITSKSYKRKARRRSKKAAQTLPQVPPFGFKKYPTNRIETAPLMPSNNEQSLIDIITVEGIDCPVREEQFTAPFTLEKGLRVDPGVGVLENIARLIRHDCYKKCCIELAHIRIGVYRRQGGFVDLEEFEVEDHQGRKWIQVDFFKHGFLFLVMFRYPDPIRVLPLPLEEVKEERASADEDGNVEMSKTVSERSSLQDDEGFIIITSSVRDKDSSQQDDYKERLERVLE